LIAVSILAGCSLVFLARLAGRPALEYWLGALVLLMAIPLIYLLIRAPKFQRPALFYVQLTLMLAYLVVEFVLDYWLQLDFRHTCWAVIAYVTLFFAATGGMIGVASLAGFAWTIMSVALFFVMAALAFVQRHITNM
jgi:hypothetical protein